MDKEVFNNSIRIVIELEVTLSKGETVKELQARWTNNKTSARVADCIEDSTLAHVTSVNTRLA